MQSAACIIDAGQDGKTEILDLYRDPYREPNRSPRRPDVILIAFPVPQDGVPVRPDFAGKGEVEP